MHSATNEQEGIQYTSLVLLLAVAVQQHKLHLNNERWMYSAANEQAGTVHPAIAVQQHKLHLNNERWMYSAANEQDYTIHQL